MIDLDIKKALLRKQPVFAQLTNEEVDVLASLLKEQHAAIGETIVREGEPVDSVYIIVNGKADVRHVSLKDNQTHIESVATLNDGDAIGLNESGFYSLSGVRTATVVAETDVVLLRLSVATFHGFALAYSHVNEIMRKQARSILGVE